jgi:c-di-GMP-binding flagellar brake protein YcgR
MGSCRRRARRLRTVKFIWFKVLDPPEGLDPSLREGLAHSCDLSLTGIGIYGASALPIGTKVFLEISTPDLQISAIGKIVYAQQKAGEGLYRIGVEFEVVPPNDLIELKKFLVPLSLKLTPRE